MGGRLGRGSWHTMIPDFDKHGYLPAGIHRATLEEIEERFGRESELRGVVSARARALTERLYKSGMRDALACIDAAVRQGRHPALITRY